MIKGITIVSAVASSGAPGAEFDRLTSLFSALGFEQGKGWQDAQGGRGAAFLAPLGNLEFVTGRPPSLPPILVEVTNLDHIPAFFEKWLLTDHRTERIPTSPSPAELTHWNSPLFTVL